MVLSYLLLGVLLWSLPLASGGDGGGRVAFDWSGAIDVLEDGVKNKAYPGCVALVANRSGILLHVAAGNFTYGLPSPLNGEVNPPMSLDTAFDIASLTKVTTTTTATAQFYQRGELPLDSKAGDILGDLFNSHGKRDITVLNLLLHNSGFPPDPEPFWNTPSFGCPQTAPYHPLENFDCSEKIYTNLLTQSLHLPIGQTYVYSDLNFLTLAHIIGNLAQKLHKVLPHQLSPSCASLVPRGPGIAQMCYFEAYVRLYVLEAVGTTKTAFGLPRVLWPTCAPEENDTEFFHSTYQGQVSDGNSFAMGGIAGHAGLFSTTTDLHRLIAPVLFPTPTSPYINTTTATLFTTIYNRTQSSRALGWNTNDLTVFDRGWNQSCGSLSPSSFMHTGYTGTMICADPARGLLVVFLTNAVYPEAPAIPIRQVRKLFTTAVQMAYDKGLHWRSISDEKEKTGSTGLAGLVVEGVE